MTITQLRQRYEKHPNIEALNRILDDTTLKHFYCGGLSASSSSLLASVLISKEKYPFVFILGNLEEAGYFYHDLVQILGDKNVLFFPSSFRRAIKFGQRNAGQEILRTEVLSRLSSGQMPLFVVTHPEAIAELVVTQSELKEKTLSLGVGEQVDIMFMQETLLSFGFQRTDYVYEPGQFAIRGSIVDVYSFSCERPYRIDFFGDEVDSIRTFEVHNQLSNGHINHVVDADIKGFFDHMSHEWMMEFLKLYIKDPNLLWLINKYLKAGVMTDGVFEESEEGSAQGSIISPILANIYMHNVLTLWYKFVIKSNTFGNSFLAVYADDFIAGFQYKEDAERYYVSLKERLKKFNLELEESKSRMIEFGRYAEANSKRKYGKKPETFGFLGFEVCYSHYFA